MVLAATSGSSSSASASRCRSSIVCAICSNFSARCVNSAGVPLRCFDALLGSFTPSIANISRPMRRCPSHATSTAANTWAMSSRSVLTKWAMVVKCGAVMPHRAMNVTCSWAHPFDRPTAHDALGVGEEHHLEQHGRRVGRRAGCAVLEARAEVGQIHLVVEQVVQRVLERAGQQLTREVDAQERRIRIERLAAGDVGCSTARFFTPTKHDHDREQIRRLPPNRAARLPSRKPIRVSQEPALPLNDAGCERSPVPTAPRHPDHRFELWCARTEHPSAFCCRWMFSPFRCLPGDWLVFHRARDFGFP